MKAVPDMFQDGIRRRCLFDLAMMEIGGSVKLKTYNSHEDILVISKRDLKFFFSF